MPSLVRQPERVASMVLSNPLTKTLGIQHPILLAGMYMAGNSELAAAVSNAGKYTSSLRLIANFDRTDIAQVA